MFKIVFTASMRYCETENLPGRRFEILVILMSSADVIFDT